MNPPSLETPEQWSDRLENYLLERATPKEDGGYKCDNCGGNIQQIECFISMHYRIFTTCTGGEVKIIPVPYCSVCEKKPDDHGCLHI